MEKCLFCDCDLPKGSLEHVFLSALGGRLATTKAICLPCNNAFANDQTGKIDDSLAASFEEIRNGLKIWTGRDKPPPTLQKAGKMGDDIEFDLAPGFVPVTRAGKLPKHIKIGSQYTLVACDENDAKRLITVLSKRGYSSDVQQASKVQTKVPTVQRQPMFDGPKIWRSVAKSAVVGSVVLFGNAKTRFVVSKDLRNAIRYEVPTIDNFVGWDFVNDWPKLKALIPHPKTPDAKQSGFEHSLIVANVGDHLVAYVCLFGAWRFSAVLGPSSDLPTCGFALNPRATKPARFIVEAEAPLTYAPRTVGAFQAEYASVLAGNQAAFKQALNQWSSEAQAEYAEQLTKELMCNVAKAGENEDQRIAVIENFARKIAIIEHGEKWETELDETLVDDRT